MAASRIAAIACLVGGAMVVAAAVLVSGLPGGLFVGGVLVIAGAWPSLGGDE